MPMRQTRVTTEPSPGTSPGSSCDVVVHQGVRRFLIEGGLPPEAAKELKRLIETLLHACYEEGWRDGVNEALSTTR